MDINPSQFKGAKLPVETVSWNDAVAFCEALTKKERVPNSWKFSLPSEAQWEYACRAGTTTEYSWGDNITTKLANYKDSGFEKTVEVGSYQPNPWGFYDMHGNVREWCRDLKEPYLNNLLIDPLSSAKGSNPILRSGDLIHFSVLRAQRIACILVERKSRKAFNRFPPLLRPCSLTPL